VVVGKEFDMFRKIDDAVAAFEHQSTEFAKFLASLTDESLKQEIAPGHRNLGRIAWHITCSYPEMANKTGLNVNGPSEAQPVPATVDEIFDAYVGTTASLIDEIKAKWTDETLEVVDDMYGMPWTRGTTLAVLLTHEVHHGGQMTVLMRQAGLVFPGLVGPTKEEWVQYGMDAPAV
jgi:uncharacterized damage-inducible protein DinB